MNCNLENLTDKELHILAELLKGKTNEEIANTQGITCHTVKAHVKNILHKTQLKHRCQLISCILSHLAKLDIYSPEIPITLQNLNITQK